MKENEAPKKLYYAPYGDIREDYPITDNDIEYIRKDAFIEKAVKFLKEWDAYRVCLEGHKDWFIEQFKKAMKL